MREYIALVDEEWLCRCDNTPSRDGFVPVRGGREVDTASRRWRGSYCCLRCGFLISWPSRDIIGYLDFADLRLRDHGPELTPGGDADERT